MASVNWDISGTGGQTIVSEGGSMRCQLTAAKLMLWNGNSSLLNAEIISDIKFSSASSNVTSGLVLRCDVTSANCYYDRMSTAGTYKRHDVYKVVAGVYTLLGSANSIESPLVYTRVRFRVDGSQISVHEWIGGVWSLVNSVIDTSIVTSGYVGLKSNSGAGYYMLYDNIAISER